MQVALTFIESMINSIQVADVSNGEVQEDWDTKTQEILDEYWQTTTNLHTIKWESGAKSVYTTDYNGKKVIVKSVPYNADL